MYGIVIYDETRGWVRYTWGRRYKTFDEAFKVCAELKVRQPGNQFDVYYTPSKRKGK